VTPYHERLTVRLREAAEEYRHGQHTGASDQRLVLLMNAAKALEDVSGNLAQARQERDEERECKSALERAIANQRDTIIGLEEICATRRAERDALRAERDTLAEQVSTGEAVLLAYDMTPQGLRGMADKLASEINNDPDCWEMDVVGALRTVAVAFTAYEGWISSAKLQRDQTQAALTEARRVLRDVVAWVDKGCPDGCPVCPGQDVHAPDCASQAALGRGEEE